MKNGTATLKVNGKPHEEKLERVDVQIPTELWPAMQARAKKLKCSVPEYLKALAKHDHARESIREHYDQRQEFDKWLKAVPSLPDGDESVSATLTITLGTSEW